MSAQKAERLLPSLAAFPPSAYVVVHHPDVQLTPEEWLELADYERLESDALADPGVVGFMLKTPQVVIPLNTTGQTGPKGPPLKVAAAKLHEGR